MRAVWPTERETAPLETIPNERKGTMPYRRKNVPGNYTEPVYQDGPSGTEETKYQNRDRVQMEMYDGKEGGQPDPMRYLYEQIDGEEGSR